MRLFVDDGGRKTMMLVVQPTTVAEVKHHVEQQLGVPVAQQALLFGGRDLPDAAFLSEDLRLDGYNTRGEVTLQLQRRLADPRSVWVTSSSTLSGRQQYLEQVEGAATMADVAKLLSVRGLAPLPFTLPSEAGCGARGNVVVGREGGGATRLVVGPEVTVRQLEAMITQSEGTAPTRMAFLQAPDGCLHAVFGPAAVPAPGEPGGNTLTVYSRSAVPQPPMAVKPLGPQMEPLTALAARVCLNP